MNQLYRKKDKNFLKKKKEEKTKEKKVKKEEKIIIDERYILFVAMPGELSTWHLSIIRFFLDGRQKEQKYFFKK